MGTQTCSASSLACLVQLFLAVDESFFLRESRTTAMSYKKGSMQVQYKIKIYIKQKKLGGRRPQH